MRLAHLFSPQLLIPMTLLTPYVFLLHYGVTALEFLILGFFVIVIVPSVIERDLWIPRFMVVFWALLTMGYIGGLINGVQWRVPIGLWNLNFGYKMLLAFAAFYAAFSFRGPVDRIFGSRFFVIFTGVLGAIALIYPFLAYSTKIQFFGVLYPPDSGFERYFTSRRMPGLGINANVYSFMALTYLTIAYRGFLDRTVTLFVPLTLLLIILVLSSKLTIVLALAGCGALTIHRAFRLRIGRPTQQLSLAFDKRGLLVTSVACASLLGIVFLATQTATGKTIVDSYATVKRFEAIMEKRGPDEGPVGFALRVHYWKKGLKRVELAPVLGIARDPFRRLSGTVVGFYNPHNEFLRMWILYGLVGLCAWLYLIAYMLYKNHRHKVGIEWLIIYAFLGVFMFFDGGLDDPRIITYLFLLLGLNWRAIARAKHAQQTTVPAIAPQAVTAPSH